MGFDFYDKLKIIKLNKKKYYICLILIINSIKL